MVMHDAFAEPRSVTRELAGFAAGLTFDQVPPAYVQRLVDDALDTVAVGMFGSTLPWVRTAAEFYEKLGGTEQATVWGRSTRLPIPVTVKMNSHAANSFEYDDTYVWEGLGLHPGNSVVTTALAIAEERTPVSGRDFITALAVGHEIAVRVRIGITKPRGGFNHTAICSTFGAAATAGRLLNLDERAMTWALGSAGCCVGGLLTMPPDSMVKRLVNGRAAEGGVTAALLAERGFTGIENILEARQGGFYGTMSDGFDLDRVVAGLGRTYHALNLQPKRYPIVTSVHSAIEAACRLVAAESLAIDDIERVFVHTNTRSQKVTTGFEPRTVTSMQMSLAFGIAAALSTGNCLPEIMREETLADPEFRDLLGKIEPIKDQEFDRIKMDSGGPAKVIVQLRGGRRIESETIPEVSRMTSAEIEDKARHLLGIAVDEASVEAIVAAFRDLVEASDVRPVARMLAFAGA